MTADLFANRQEVTKPAAPQSVKGCRRLRGKHRCGAEAPYGNICFLSDEHLRLYCRDMARLKMRFLAGELARMGAEERKRRLDGFFRAGWAAKTVEWLARKSEPPAP